MNTEESHSQLLTPLITTNTPANLNTPPSIPTSSSTPIATPTITQTKLPIPLTNTYTSEPSPTKKPTIATPTHTLEPTPSPISIKITPQSESISCPEPDFSQGNRVDVTFPPFCIVWVDTYEEEAFVVQLDYPNEPLQLLFEVESNITQLVVPEEYSPEPNQSFEECSLKKDFLVTVFAIFGNRQERVGGMAVNSECQIDEN